MMLNVAILVAVKQTVATPHTIKGVIVNFFKIVSQI